MYHCEFNASVLMSHNVNGKFQSVKHKSIQDSNEYDWLYSNLNVMYVVKCCVCGLQWNATTLWILLSILTKHMTKSVHDISTADHVYLY